jgi:hypothetical protein
MTATCLNTNGIEAVLRICCCAAGSIVFHGRKTTALSLTVSTPLKTIAVGQVGQGTLDARNRIVTVDFLLAIAVNSHLTKSRLARGVSRDAFAARLPSAFVLRKLAPAAAEVRGKRSPSIPNTLVCVFCPRSSGP